MKQPAVARLEAGEHNPSFDTLSRLSHAVGIKYHIRGDTRQASQSDSLFLRQIQTDPMS